MPIMNTTYDPTSATTQTSGGGMGGGSNLDGLIEQLIANKLRPKVTDTTQKPFLGANSMGTTPEQMRADEVRNSQLADAAQQRDLRQRMFDTEQEKAKTAEQERLKLMKPRNWSPMSGMHSTWQDILSTNNPEEYKTYQAAAMQGIK